MEPSAKNPELNSFLTHSTKSDDWGIKTARIMQAALSAVEPFSAAMEGFTNPKNFKGISLHKNDLPVFGRIKVIGAGKAGQPMAEAAQKYFGDQISAGIVIVKDGYAKKPSFSNQIRIIEANHPIPDQRGQDATREIITLLEDSQADDLVLCLISGGGSALLVSPVPGVTLSEMQQLTELLLASGATINEINSLRKHLDQVKGGQLARAAFPAQLVCLILSDVVGDPLDVIASGPTVPDPSTFQDAYEVLVRYKILERVPTSIRAHIERGIHGNTAETPKPGDDIFSKVHNVVIGSNTTAAQAAAAQSKLEGFNTLILTNFLQGEARQAGRFLGSILRQIAVHDQPIARPACIIAGGETTVTLQGAGMGGRNQELALASAAELKDLDNVALIALATDGGDGPSNAAGAVATGTTLSRAAALNLDPLNFLSNNDSYHFFLPLGDLLRIGPTMTNVNDLTFLFAF